MIKKIIRSIIFFVLILTFSSCSTKDKITNEEYNNMKIKVNGYELIVNLEDNSSAHELISHLKKENIIISMQDYGNFEKVGRLPFSLPRNDEYFTTKPGDIILYQGNQFVIYYDTNSYSFTKLGSIENATKEKLLEILGKKEIVVEISI